MEEYRSRIYSQYELLWPDQKTLFDEEEALRWGRYYLRLLKDFLPKDKNSAILELGCGTGRLLYNLKLMGYSEVKGVDLSAEQARIARQTGIDVEQRDVFDVLSENPETFQLIIALDFFEHFSKDECLRLLDACRDALQPGGRLVLQTVNAQSPMGLSCRYADFTHETCVTPGCLRNLMTLCGFKDYQARERAPIPYGMVSFIRFVLWGIIRRLIWMYDMVEVTGTTYPIYTRNFIGSAVKK
ncbi:MAG: class I SAM-dependent methyltransferase [Desulfomonile tiedjei]|uniref:Class I SAM-dependent methyltransferase n=1 Tax=Desulfomonile tiedjei TaxID=2358 RepID=A0A9D6V135_9BACT|nr:class I SAM-dependent methyltransferase [Desulfomonile tiedjei]